MREIELKAHVSDPEAVRESLSLFMEFQGEFDKRDEYWAVGLATTAGASRQFSFRLRTEPGRNMITYKEKSYRDRMEVNEEIEFALDDRDSFLVFLKKMGAKRLYSKRKKGGLWRGADGLQAELVEVESLGYFLEVEKMTELSTGQDLEEIREKLIEVLMRCGLKERNIEGRPYSQLLGHQAT